MHRLTPLALAIAALLAVLVPVGLAFWVLRQNAQRHDLERFETGLKLAEVAVQRRQAAAGGPALDPEELIREAYREAGEGMFDLKFDPTLQDGVPGEPSGFRRLKQTELAGRPVLYLVSAGPRFWRQSQQVMASIVFGSGAVVALALGGVGWALARQRIALADRVAERTEELRTANEKLTQAVAREQELNAMKTSFVSMVSHELRTPMQIIQSSAELLERYAARLAPEQREQHFQAIGNAIRRVTNLTEEVLLFSRLEAARLALEIEPLDLAAWLPALIAEVQTAHPGHGPIELAGAIPERVQADERLLRHILGNVLGNALKYSPPGAPVSCEVSAEGTDVIFLIVDRGIGIPPGDQARLFVSFHRGENARHVPGTGLGLVIVKRCVELHRGRITLTSQAGEGTTVCVRLPLSPV